MKLDRRSLWNLFKLAAAAVKAAGKKPEAQATSPRFVYMKHQQDDSDGRIRHISTGVSRDDIARIDVDAGPWDDRTKHRFLQAGWRGGEPELRVAFGERMGPNHGRTVPLYGREAKRFLDWWRG